MLSLLLSASVADGSVRRAVGSIAAAQRRALIRANSSIGVTTSTTVADYRRR